MEWDLSKLLMVIRQRLLFLLITTLTAVGITAFISYYLLPSKYEVTTTLLVQPQTEEARLNYQDIITNEKLVSTFGEIIRSRTVANDVIERQ
ncbi:Wzz/FepE/Etk N-terminal domain-containing protein [Brevibacillus daliensis]|uniref:Wzz/FepE/Etk N-terminal domain-containing protein n=1 Tax=Brevibacillus daliensis TaxID=2892995 RepID=UPI001E52A734|nr:Wzz/FepE/Etk N-terminal domain-containing protein [Brevibacillus daliensis]